MKLKLILVMPTLNERIGLESVYHKLPITLFDRVVVVDAWSNDGTVEWCHERNIEVFPQKVPGLRQGLGDFISTLEENSMILTFSPDGNCDPETLERFVEVIRSHPEARLVLGSRYAGGTSSDDDDFLTALGNRFFTGACNLVFRSKFTDVFSIYRAFDSRLIYELGLDEDESYAWLERLLSTKVPWEPLMSYRAAKYKVNWIDVPVGEPERIGGERKLQVFRWGASFLLQLIREVWYAPKSKR